MKNDKFLDKFGEADDRYIEEAAPDATLRRARGRLWRRALALAACLSLVIGLNFWLFLPYSTTAPDVSRYSQSAYFEIIEKLNDFTFKPPKYKNNAHSISARISGFFGMFFAGAGADAPGDVEDGGIWDDGAMSGGDESAGGPSGGEYVEITDNQVAGVIEGDIVKRTSDYIFHLHGDKLSVYSINGEESDTVGTVNLFPERNIGFNAANNELYLSEDCTTATVVFSYYSYDKSPPVASLVDVISLDVTNPAEITEQSRITLKGTINTSRLVSGELLLLTNYNLNQYEIDFTRPETYLPFISQNGEKTYLGADSIVCPSEVSASRYTVITKLDQKTLAVKGAGAFLSYTEDAYITKTTVYATRPYTETKVHNNRTTETRRLTEIAAIDYSGDVRALGSITVEGEVNNQYSLDEYNGILRVAASVSGTVSSVPEAGADISNWGYSYKDASLYCIDLSDFSLRASVERFCPDGEEVTSARFSGNTAYICTANKQYFTDPVYMFDLTDLDNITYKDTGIIDGYSTSLTEFGGGFLLGIGVGEWRDTAKIEIYEEGESAVNSVAVFECYGTIAEEYKCHFIDRENRFIGITVSSYAPKTHTGTVDFLSTAFVLLAFNGDELEVARIIPLEELGSSAIFFVRAFTHDGYLYLISDRGLDVISLAGRFDG